MTHRPDTPKPKRAEQAAAAHGTIAQPQQTDAIMREKDTARGAEGDLRRASRGQR
ncbi:MAG TPA: hypothetical protein PKD92_12910 [Novosphingobium sp.]|nr:hypothetical protein [Novosphingobium sp.]HMP57455.1 hypothetical protein [Novosphingobium sp.]